MAPIRPGEQSQRGMARSSTTGNLEQRKAAYKEARSRKGNPANYMRPTSSSIARRNSAVPSPPLSVPPSTRRRPSAEYPLGIKIDRASTPGIRLSSSNSSRALRANVKSDLPFRELYGTKADEIKVQTASRAARFMVDTEDQVQTANNAQGSTTSSNTQQAAPTPSGPSSEFTVTYDPGQEADFNSVKSPEFQITPILNPGEVAEASEAAFHDSPGHTPLNLMGLQHMSFPAGGLGKSKLRQNALDSPLSEPETVIYQPETSVKQGKRREQHAGVDADLFATHNRQHENMGYYDEEGYTAPTKQDESTEESCEGDTIIRGGIGDVDTNSGRSIIMRANTVSPSLLEEEDEDDPRNVYSAMPHGWWTGRISSLNDKFRNEALLSDNATTHPMMDDTRRMRRVFTELASFCKTPEAKQSMDEYAFEYWNKQGRQPPLPMIQPTTAPTLPAGGATQEKEKEGGGKEKKKGVLNKLRLRRKSGM